MIQTNHTTYFFYYDYVTLAYVGTVMSCGLVCNAFTLYIFTTRKTYRLHIMAKYQVLNVTLTVLDLVICLVGMPLDITFMISFPANGRLLICHITVVVLLTCAVSSSIILVAISALCYLSVTHPIHPAITDRRFACIPAVVVPVAFLFAVPYTFVFEKRSVTLHDDCVTDFCQVNLPVPGGARSYHLSYLIFLITVFVSAFVVMSCNYLRLSRRLNIIFSTQPEKGVQPVISSRDTGTQQPAAKLEGQFSRAASCPDSQRAVADRSLSSDVDPLKVSEHRVISKPGAGEQCHETNILPDRLVLVESPVDDRNSKSRDGGTPAASPGSAGENKMTCPGGVMAAVNKIEGGGKDISEPVVNKSDRCGPLDGRLPDLDSSSLCTDEDRKRALRITGSLMGLPRSEYSASAKSSNACLGCFTTPCRRESQERHPGVSSKGTTTFLDSSTHQSSVLMSYSCSTRESPTPTHPSKRMKALRMLGLVIMEFVLCYLPYLIYLIVCYYIVLMRLSRVEVTLINLAMRTFYLQTVLTPMIYILYNARFRRDLHRTLGKLKRCTVTHST